MSVAMASGPCASGVRTPMSEDPAAIQMIAGSEAECPHHALREERTDERPHTACGDHDSEEERIEVELAQEVDRVEHAVERAGNVGDDRSERHREHDSVATHGAQTLDDLLDG